MKIINSEKNSLAQEYTVEIAKSDWDDAQTSACLDVQAEAKITGFRKGKIPPVILFKNFGNQILQTTHDKVIDNVFLFLTKEEKIDYIGRPRVYFADGKKKDENIVDKENKPLKIKAEFVLTPSITLDQIKQLAISQFEPSVSDADVEERLNSLRIFWGDLEKDTETMIVNRSSVIDADCSVWKNDNIVRNYDDARDRNGSLFFAIDIPNFRCLPTMSEVSNELCGKKIGDDLSVKVKEFEFKMHIRGVYNILPKNNDEFISQKMSIPANQNLQAVIKRMIMSEVDRHFIDENKNNIKNQLLALCNFDIPKHLLEKEITTLKQQQASNNSEKVASDEELSKIAGDNLIFSFIIISLSRLSKIEITDEEMNEQLGYLEERFEGTKSQFKKYVATNDIHDRMSYAMIQEKVFKLVLDNANVSKQNKTIKDVPGGSSKHMFS